MSQQSSHAAAFHALHRKGDPLILFNIWDPGSAGAVVAAGARAIATGSAPVALAHGFSDGEKIPLELAMDNLRRIVGAVDVPVTADIEGGYGAAPEAVANTVSRACETGAVGFNFEDQIVGTSDLYDVETQSARIAAARRAADSIVHSIFINARTDIFLKAKPETHSEAMLDDAIDRAKAYEQAGASGFFAPGLADEKLIARLCDETALPVNIIALPHVPAPTVLAGLGVARVSYGPVPYRRMVKWLEDQASEAFSGL
ncbi:MAG: isocitrate lyase/phosphoenolpyruvate mutase family protein [Alphaproteobacteria bacterium]|nr:isocitrate lyase/phosphoenolpyruvate mutase family protein [Alphaproteobacteria bacterium]